MGVYARLGHGVVAILLLVILKAQSTMAVDNLQVLYQWKHLDFAWPNEETKLLFSHYIRENNNPMGVEIVGDRLFITIPRWTSGIAATVNYVYLNDTSESPLLNPYPSWNAHRFDGENIPEVISTFRIWADKCDRLWVLDTGIEAMSENRTQVVPPRLVVYNLTDDQILRNYVIPTDQTVYNSHFANVVVEDSSCDESFAYLADIRNPGLIVYSWESNDSWLVQHHYFYPDPMAGHFNTSGVFFQWWDGVINLALASEKDGYSTLYFHPLCSNAAFTVNTRILQDPELATSSNSFHEFSYLGSRDSNGQAAASYVDPKTGILFHALSLSNSIGCWNPSSKTYDSENVVRIYQNDNTLAFPGDVKIDDKGNIWTISNRLPVFKYGELDSDDYNYRVLTGSVENAVAGTVCAKSTASSSAEGIFSIMVSLVLAFEHGRKLLETL